MVALASKRSLVSVKKPKVLRRAAATSRAAVAGIVESAINMPSRFRFTVEQFYELGRQGFFAPDQRVELIHGELIMAPPTDPPHADGTHKTQKRLLRLTHDPIDVRCQHPIDLGNDQAPMPDVAVVTARSYAEKHPTPADIHLLIEVASSTLRYDLSTKRDLYAQAGIKEYWVLDLPNRQLHVFTKPSKGLYKEQRILADSEAVQCSVVKGIKVKVKDLLP